MLLEPAPFTKTDDLPEPREPIGHIRFRFTGDASEDDEHPLWDISACGRAGKTIFVAGDSDDLWILAGPTQALDGRCAIYLWEGWG